MHSTASPPNELVAPAESVLRDALDCINAETCQTGAVVFRTVRDVLHGDVHGPCRLGKRWSRTWIENPRIMNSYMRCRGWKCPRCAPDQLERYIMLTLAAWEGELEQVHRLDLDAGEWEARTPRVLRLRNYSKRFVRVRLHAGGDAVFTPGPTEGADPVPVGELGRALVDAILGASADPKRKRRFTWATRDTEGCAAEDKLRGDEPEREKPRCVNLPRDISPEDANARFEEELGRELSWAEVTSKTVWRGWSADDVTADEIGMLRERVQDEWDARDVNEKRAIEHIKTWAR